MYRSKDVELAKLKVDATRLIVPFDGVLIDDSGIHSGLYISPSSYPLTFIDTSDYIFTVSIEQHEVSQFLSPKPMSIVVDGIDREYNGTSITPYTSNDNKVALLIRIDAADGLIDGFLGEAWTR